MGRSGSTMLANLLTLLPVRWVMIEPWLAKGAYTQSLFKQMQRLGFPVTTEAWSQPETETRPAERITRRLQRLISPCLQNLTHWGVKEVRAELHDPTVALIRPQKVMLLVRDIRDVALSLYEKHERQSGPDSDPSWMRGYLCSAAEKLVQWQQGQLQTLLPHTPYQLIHYEALVSSAETRQSLSEWLHWPLSGDPGLNLDLYQRGYEQQRHGQQITAASVNRRNRQGISPDHRRFAEEMAAINQAYQHTFGYQ